MNATINKSCSLSLIGMPAWDMQRPFHALALVAGVAREAGFCVNVFDLNINFYHLCEKEEKKYWDENFNHLWFAEDLPKQLWERYKKWFIDSINTFLSDIQPSLIAFSVNMSTRFHSICAAKYIKKTHPAIPIMFGGVDCFKGEQNTSFLNHKGNTYCDIICQGEGEISFKKYLLQFKKDNDWKTSVPGFAYYDHGMLVDTGDVELPSLQEKLPIPAYDLFDMSKYTEKGGLPFYFSRGCVYNCHFCSEKPNFKRYRCRKAEEAFEELMAILPYAQKYTEKPTLIFGDSIVNVNMKELNRFMDLILENNIKVQWGAQGHIHHLMTWEVLEKMAQAGFFLVFWGIESGSQHTINLMNKQFFLSDARRIMDDCIKLEIEQHIPILIGFPGERPVDVVDTLELIFQYKDKPHCHVHQPNLIVVRPNSPLYENYISFGLANNNHYDWYTIDQTNTLPIRIVRRFVSRQAHSNQELSLKCLVDNEEIKLVKLNDLNVAKDLYLIVHEIFSRGNSLDVLYSSIISWCERQSEKCIFDTKYGEEVKKKCMAIWMKVDKDSREGRDKVYQIVLSALKRLKIKLNGCQHTRTLPKSYS